MNRKTLLRKFATVGGYTFLSRILGIMRELLFVRYLGVNACSDAFSLAYKIPTMLRKIFAEGALSASLIPSLVEAHRDGRRDIIDGLLFLTFIVFEALVLVLCALTIWYAEPFLRFLGPGFSHEQITLTASLLRILMPYIFFLSSSAIFGSALQSTQHFLIPALTPALMNIVFIGSLGLCIQHNLPVKVLCYSIILAGALQLLMHIAAYLRLKFSFGKIIPETITIFKPIFVNVIFCMVCAGATEISLLIDASFASYLQAGSITLINYGTRFMGIPLGLFATSFATILLPYFARIGSYAPNRLGFCLIEAAKLICWVTLPVSIVMSFFAEDIYRTLFLSDKFTLAQVFEARNILGAFLVGLFPIALNKTLLNIYYSRQVVWIPTIITLIGAGVNIGLNRLLVGFFQATGLAFSTSCSQIIQSILLIICLYYWFGYRFYAARFMRFVVRYSIQLMVILPVSWLCYHGIVHAIQALPGSMPYLLMSTVLLWLWVGPLCLLGGYCVYRTRRLFGVSLYFLD